jgi:tricorn protease-like protein
VAALTLAALVVATAWSGVTKTERVSVRSNGDEVNIDNDFAAISGNGRFVAFESVGKFVAPDVPNADADVFVHDRKTGKTRRVSVKSNGDEVNADSEEASISANGRLVAFASEGALVGSDTNGTIDVYVHDRKTGKTRRMSVKSNGDQVSADSENPAISADGTVVAFDSDGAFTTGDTNGAIDVWEHGLGSGKTKRVSLRANGTEPTEDSTLSQDTSPNRATRVSADGRFVAFQSADGQMTGQPDYGPTPLFDSDVFVRDMKKRKTRRVSLKSNGTEADPNAQVASLNPAISADGRFVAFQSAGALVGADSNGIDDIYVNDRKTGKTSRVSVRSNGDQGAGASRLADLSANGRWLVFESEADLVGSDGNGFRDVYLRDRQTAKTRRISLRSNGDPVDANHQLAAISSNGRVAAFSSLGAFTGGDSGNDFDVFVRGPLH